MNSSAEYETCWTRQNCLCESAGLRSVHTNDEPVANRQELGHLLEMNTLRNRCSKNGTILILAVCAVLLPAIVSAQAGESTALRSQIDQLAASQSPTVHGAPIAAAELIQQIYERRNYVPAWTDTGMIKQLFDQVLRSVEHGLDPDDFHARQIGARRNAGAQAQDPSFQAETEVLCTDALLRLGVTLHFGKLDPAVLDPTWNFDRTIRAADPVEVFDSILRSKDISAALEGADPNTAFYNNLRSALVQYRGIMAKGGWDSIPEGPVLAPKSVGSRVIALRKRLTASGDLQNHDPADPALYDDTLAMAVKRFQERHGIEVDGKVGRDSITELNVPVEQRIDQIRANLERIRWVFRDIGDDFIIVDIAGYHVYLVKNGEIQWSARVQVGKPFHATPIFKDTMLYLDFNPTWTIPPGILRNETLPAIRKDANYLSRNNMSVVSHAGKIIDPATIDWAATANSGFAHMIRQEPGPHNALGRVKFIFPNTYMVYLHDTPSKGLFARTARAFSHGCIRVENPFDLAEHLLSEQGWDRTRIDDAVASKKNTRVNLTEPLTVMLLYWTAQADEHGTVFFRKVP